MVTQGRRFAKLPRLHFKVLVSHEELCVGFIAKALQGNDQDHEWKLGNVRWSSPSGSENH